MSGIILDSDFASLPARWVILHCCYEIFCCRALQFGLLWSRVELWFWLSVSVCLSFLVPRSVSGGSLLNVDFCYVTTFLSSACEFRQWHSCSSWLLQRWIVLRLALWFPFGLQLGLQLVVAVLGLFFLAATASSQVLWAST